MKILIISRATLYSAPGGDTIQIIETASHLRKLGLIIDISLTNEVIDYSTYDILHFFNVIRPADILFHVAKSKKKFVISPIFVDYGEFEKKARPGFIKYINKIFSAESIEYFKTIMRMIINGERIKSFEYLYLGQKGSIIKILKKCGILLPNSQNEYNRLIEKFNIKIPYIVVPNAINGEKFQKEPNVNIKKGVICVARFEPLKNQLNIIKAINQTDYSLILIGKSSPNSQEFYKACKNEAFNNPNIKFIDHINQDELISYYYNAKVHVLASWFETTGLSSLEAAVSRCNIVITDKGDTLEYFGNSAFYCIPDDVESIKVAINKAYETDSDSSLRDNILEKYTWNQTAKQTLIGYQKVLNEN